MKFEIKHSVPIITPPKQDPIATPEMATLAKIRSSNLSDWAIQIAYHVGNGEWNKASQACLEARTTLDVLAGTVAKIL